MDKIFYLRLRIRRRALILASGQHSEEKRQVTADLGRGLLGSIERRVAAELLEHMALNRTIQRLRYPLWQRILQSVIEHTFIRFLITYGIIDVCIQLVSVAFNRWWPDAPPFWVTPSDTKSMLKDVDGFLITAQVGMLGVISVAVGLVSIIAQRTDGASDNPDIQIYYAESFVYGVVSSSIALLLVMCVEALWPLQFLSHLAGIDHQNVVIKVTLTAVHILWLLANLAAFVQFLLVSLHMVEPVARQEIRQNYTVNRSFPDDLRRHLNSYMLLQARQVLNPAPDGVDSLLFGIGPLSFGEEREVEMTRVFRRATVLRDIRTRLLMLALRSWWRRSQRRRQRG